MFSTASYFDTVSLSRESVFPRDSDGAHLSNPILFGNPCSANKLSRWTRMKARDRLVRAVRHGKARHGTSRCVRSKSTFYLRGAHETAEAEVVAR